MAPVDRLIVRIQASIDRALPWYDEIAAARQHRAARRVIQVGDAVIAGRTEVMRSSYRRAGQRLGR